MDSQEALNIDGYFNELHNDFVDTKSQRDILIEKMMKVATDVELKPGEDKAQITEVKLACVKEAANLLNDKEKRSERITKLNLAKKVSEDDVEVSGNIVSFLKGITKDNMIVVGPGATDEDDTSAIAIAHQRSGKTISSGETRVSSEDYT